MSDVQESYRKKAVKGFIYIPWVRDRTRASFNWVYFLRVPVMRILSFNDQIAHNGLHL